jgi:methionyl-tRNA formyltransferase
MKLIFAGTPEFAAQALVGITGSRHEVVLVLTRPDRPAGRGMKLQHSPVKQLAEKHGIPVFQPPTLKDVAQQGTLFTLARASGAVVLVVAAYGLILPQAVLDMCPRGAINIHGSLLPRWRGAAPIQRALLAGDTETGICIMQMDAGLDTGPVLLSQAVPIAATDDTQSLHDKLAEVGAHLIVAALDRLETGALPATPQPAEGATYARKIDKAEARIDWNQPADAVDRHIRAFRPIPGAVTALDGKDVKIWRATIAEKSGTQAPPGTVLGADTQGIRVACNPGTMNLTELQKAGGQRLSAADFLRGAAVKPGTLLGAPIPA